MRYVLVTGGAGFIGANFVEYLFSLDKDYHILVLDKLTYAGDKENLKKVWDHTNFTFIKGDITDTDLLQSLFNQYQISNIVHFAAESHVDNSITGPEAFIQTNIIGTFRLLEQCRNTWLENANELKEEYKNARFLHVSTDEVYGTLGKKGLFKETTAYAPNSPYSASKASSDFLVRSYYHTYGLPVITTNCSNNYGPYQHREKLIPTIIRKALAGELIPIYGTGENIRDWLYVTDHCEGIYLAWTKGRLGETYNIGGKNEKTNIEIADIICDILDKKAPSTASYSKQISFVEDRLGHDFRYAIDATKITNELNWKAKENFASGIEKTVDWYLDNRERL